MPGGEVRTVALMRSGPAVGFVSLFVESTAILMHIRAEVLSLVPSFPMVLGDASEVFNIVGQLSYVESGQCQAVQE